MSNVDSRVVSLQFDNSEFSTRVQETILGLENLNQTMEFNGATAAFDQLTDAANSMNLSELESSISTIESRFGALGAIAFTTLQEITREAISTGQKILDATVGKITNGGKARSIAIEQAKFQFRGLGQDVEKSMASALAAVEGTAYGLDEAATAASTFGAAGIEAGDEMTGALRGVAGIAGITNSAFGDISQIFTTMSGLGKITSTQLYQFSTRGIGIAAEMAKHWGLTEQAVREMVTEGEISFKDFAQFADEAFGKHAQSANQTYTGSLANLKSAFKKLGAEFYDLYLPEARDVFNDLRLAVSNLTKSMAPMINAFGIFVKGIGEATSAALWRIDFDGIRQGFSAFSAPVLAGLQTLGTTFRLIFGTIGKSFRNAFGKTDVVGIVGKIANGFKKLTEALLPSGQTLEKLESIFSGIFSVFAIGFEIVKGVFGVVKDLIAGFSGLGTSALDVGAGFGDTLVSLKEFLVDGGRIRDFFDDIGGSVRKFLELFDFGSIGTTLGDFFGALNEGSESIAGVENRVGGLQKVFDKIGVAIGWLKEKFEEFKNTIRKVGNYIQEAFGGLGDAMAEGVRKADFSKLLDALNVGIIATLLLTFKNFFAEGKTLKGLTVSISGISGAFIGVTRTLTIMQAQLKAVTLKKIAEALALLTVSIVALSLIDSEDLTRSLAAITAGMTQLMAALFVLTKINMPFMAAQLYVISAAMTALGTALILFSIATYILSNLSWTELATGLVGTTVLLGGMAAAAKLMTSTAHGFIYASIGMIAMGVALLIMTAAVKSLAKLDWDDLAKGLLGVLTLLGAMSLAARAMTGILHNFVYAGVGMLFLSVGLIALAFAVRKMSELSWEEMARGMVGVIGVLAAMTIAATVAGTAGGAGAAGLAVLSATLIGFAYGMQQLAKLSWGDMARGFVAMGVGLLILGGVGALLGVVSPLLIAGAVGLVIMSGALIVFTTAITALSVLPWDAFLKGMAILLITMGGLALMASLILPLAPAMYAVGASLAIFGLALLVAGAGAFLMAKAFESLAGAGAAGLKVLDEALHKIVDLIPSLLSTLAEGIIEFLGIIFEASPEIIEGIGQMISDLITKIVELLPEVQVLIEETLQRLAEIIIAKAPIVAEAIFVIILSILGELDKNMPEIVERGTNIIVNFLRGIAARMGDIAKAADDIVLELIKGILANPGRIVKVAVDAIVNFLKGIANSIRRIVNAGVEVVAAFIEGVALAIPRLVDRAAKAMIDFLNGMSDSIENNKGELIAAFSRLGRTLVDALGDAIKAAIGGIGGIIKDGITSAVSGLGGFIADAIPGIGSPEKVMIEVAEKMNEGFTKGLQSGEGGIVRATESIGAKLRRQAAVMLEDMEDFNPTITPVLDLSGAAIEAKKISDVLGIQSLQASITLAEADTVSSNGSDTSDDDSDDTDDGPKQLIFEQNNYSPDPLSTGKIYRNTKGQIAAAQEALGLS